MFTRFNFKALAALNDEVSNDENVEVDPNLSKILQPLLVTAIN